MVRFVCISLVGAAQLAFTVFVLAPIAALLLACSGVVSVWRWVELQAIFDGDEKASDRAEWRSDI